MELLRVILKKEVLFHWNEQISQSFQDIKALILKSVETPLRYYYWSQSVTAQTDASQRGLGTLNVRGLGNRIKRRTILNYFKNKNLDIACMQEVHCSAKLTKLWQTEWGSKWCAALGNNNSRGVAIIFNPKLNVKVMQTGTDHDGRHVICTIKKDDKEFTLCNVYAPNVDSLEFFINLFKILSKYARENIVLGGDFNLVLDPSKDRLDSLVNNHAANKVLKACMDELNLVDIWRIWNKEECKYTWFRRHETSGKLHSTSRIDMILVNNGLAGNVINTDITLGCKTDHSLVTIEIEDNSLKKGPGVWKFNNKLLQDESFCEKIKESINQTMQIPGLTKTNRWLTIKTNCIDDTKEFTKGCTHEKNTLLCNLYNLKSILMQDKQSTELYPKVITEVSDKIDELEHKQLNVVIFWSRYQWAREGEKNTKYFLSLEKRNYNDKTMFAILKDEILCKDQCTILDEQKHFYECLYKSNKEVVFFMSNQTDAKLDFVQKEYLDTNPSIDEIHMAALSMKCNKVAGCDGLSLEFYLHFFDHIKAPLFQMYLECKSNGIFGLSTWKGLISLLPKKDKDLHLLKILRPLTLLNIDYKILAKTLATRLKKVLLHLIGEQQTGFMEKRCIQENIRTTIDVIMHIYNMGKRTVVISIDFEKCFDHIEHESIYNTMKYFNIGDNFIAWVRLFFTKFLLITQNVSFVSDPFCKGCGVNQGCNISPFIANVCTELMAHKIKLNPKIQGVRLNDNVKGETEFIISQFADNIVLFLEFTEECLNEAISTLTLIECNTGLKVSYEKSTLYRVGALKNSNAKIYTTKNFHWSDGDLNILGVVVKNQAVQTSKGLDLTIEKMNVVISQCHNRCLTLMGKVLLINALMALLF